MSGYPEMEPLDIAEPGDTSFQSDHMILRGGRRMQAGCANGCAKASPCCRKLSTKIIWVFTMIGLGACDCFINWVNFMELNAREHSRGLVLGPVPPFLRISLLVFSIVGTVFFILESINTLSIFTSKNGQTRVPLVWEQIVILTLEHIPLCAINFFISQCRSRYFTLWQTASASIYIVYILTRLVWHAHQEGRLLRDKPEYEQRKCVFLAVCALYSCSMAFPIICWRFGLPTSFLKDSMEEINVYLLKAPFLEQRNIDNYDLTPLLLSQGRELNNPWVTKSLQPIILNTDLHTASYDCNFGPNITFTVPECTEEGRIIFSFQYPANSDIEPFGEIQYNYAFVPEEDGGASPGRGNSTCVPSEGMFQDGWNLYYLRTVLMLHQDPPTVIISSPWESTCKAPVPWYNRDIPVCSHYGYST